MSQLYRIQHLHTALAQGTLILTPNRRIAEKIKQAWAATEANNVIRPPAVYAIHDWLNQLNDIFSLQTKILSDNEKQALWEIVVSDINHGLLMPASAIAELVSSADDLLQQWCIHHKQLPDDPDSQLLKQCITAFERQLAKHSPKEYRVTTNFRFYKTLEKLFIDDRINAPEEIILTGFDDLTPLLKNILVASGSRITSSSTPAIASTVKTTKLGNSTQEIYTAAIWAKKILHENLASSQNSSIGIIVPDLNVRRNEVERILQNVFEPQYIKPEIPRYSPPFNISVSESLAKQPIISCALDLLTLNRHTTKLNDFLSILHCPFWSDYKNEIIERIQIEQYLRKIRWDKLSLTDLRMAANPNNSFHMRLAKLETSRVKQNRKQYPSEWLGLIQEQLSTLGWPGSRRLDSVEYQQVKQFQKILDELVSLDDIFGKTSFEEILKKLRELCQKTLYHAQTQDSPIQILGVLEGSGLHFDAVWVCGMGEHAWPPAVKPHPLLPLALQIENNMPHCSVAREEHYCKNVTKDFLNSAENIVISFPEEIEESKQGISAFFSSFPAVSVENLLNQKIPEQHPYLEFFTKEQSCWQIIHDNGKTPFTDSKTRGGQGLLKAQAKNPFDAFAIYRLHARALDEPTAGLPKSERGVLIHTALQYFWKNLGKNQQAGLQALLTQKKDDRNNLIDASIENAFRTVKHPALLNEAFRNIEKQQLIKHLHAWLALEEQRAPFVVIALEKQVNYKLNGIELTLTMDRVDQLSDGSFILIDYKTTSGNLSVQLWKEERLAEPQLPLYCLATPNAAGISFAQVNLDTMRFVSMGCHPDIPALTEKKISSQEYWQAQQQQWQHQLTQLMQEFKDGHAEVSFANNKVPEHSEYLLGLNRWYEKELIEDLLQSRVEK